MRRAALRRSELCAVSLLCEQGLSSIYALSQLQIPRMKLPVAVEFDSFDGFCTRTGTARTSLPEGLPEGMTLRFGGKYLILYREGEHPRRLNFTLAHELGHVLLGHVGEQMRAEEAEANAFAASLLCPAAAVYYLSHRDGGFPTAEALTAIFPLSLEAARLRLRDLCKKPKRPPTDEEITLLLQLFGRIADAPQNQ